MPPLSLNDPSTLLILNPNQRQGVMQPHQAPPLLLSPPPLPALLPVESHLRRSQSRSSKKFLMLINVPMSRRLWVSYQRALAVFITLVFQISSLCAVWVRTTMALQSTLAPTPYAATPLTPGTFQSVVATSDTPI